MPTIAIDPTEAREGTNLPELQGAIVVPGLEEVTGADIMLSTYAAPVSSAALIKRHCLAGALLIQRKSGDDFINSLGARLNDSLARMWEVAKLQCQRVLLVTGKLEADASNMAVLNGRLLDRSYLSVVGALSRWHDRGGVVETLSSDTLIPAWVNLKLMHLEEYYTPGGEIKRAYPDIELRLPDTNDPMQLPVRIRDGRLTLVTLPGIGEERAEELWTWGKGNLAYIVNALCTPATLKREDRPRGIGPATIAAVRRHFGYSDEPKTKPTPVAAQPETL